MTTAAQTLLRNIEELASLLPKLRSLDAAVEQLCQRLLRCWEAGGKVLIAGNGGSAADAMHFAEELIVRFQKNRRPLAAIALCDPTVITCAGNDLGYDQIFSRQVAGLGRPGDVLIVLSTSGNSRNLVHAVAAAREIGMRAVAMLGKGGGQLKGACELELIVPSEITHHIQEAHKIIYHAVCQWLDEQVD